MAITVIMIVLAAYLIGSVNFAVIISSAFIKKDVRKFGSGNAGATNVLRTAGVLPGILTFLGDALKGFCAAMLGYLTFKYMASDTSAFFQPIYGAYLCGLFCMLGHIFPVFFQFKGGKGVAICVGIFAVCSYKAIIAGLLVFAIVTALTKYVSLGSVLATVVTVVLSIVFYNKTALLWPQAILSIAMGTIIITKHSENIKRLLQGTESKIGKGGNNV